MGMETEKKFYVYVDYREDDGKPFYVGKGLEERVKIEKRNSLHTNIKNKHGIIREIVFESNNEQETLDKEVQLIQELQTHIDHGNGGANFTLGGEGISGYRFTEKQREKLYDNPAYRKMMSESKKKMWEDPEYREKMKKTKENPEYREKMSGSQKKLWEDPEHREKVSQRIKDHHSDPEFKKKQGEKMRKVLSDPEIREKISKISKEKLSDPEIRKKISEKVKLSAEKLTPEQRSERTRLGWETRKLKKLQQEI
jgi:uncharacterized membrane-anchored protein YjiN (DUF445 family)